jgi:hypothetical protein
MIYGCLLQLYFRVWPAGHVLGSLPFYLCLPDHLLGQLLPYVTGDSFVLLHNETKPINIFDSNRRQSCKGRAFDWVSIPIFVQKLDKPNQPTN